MEEFGRIVKERFAKSRRVDIARRLLARIMGYLNLRELFSLPSNLAHFDNLF